jgi:hypothetical protein
MADKATFERLRDAMGRGMKAPGRESSLFDERGAEQVADRFDQMGVRVVGFKSSREDLEAFDQKLEDQQATLLDERHREWLLHLYYLAGQQSLVWHRDRRAWIPRKLLPWRVSSRYNVIAKYRNIRVGRLTENKPGVTVQARSADRGDIEKAAFKERQFWYLWDRLAIHRKIVMARRWAYPCGSGFLKCGWNAEYGDAYPATEKEPRLEQVEVPAIGLDGLPMVGPDGMPVMQVEEVETGVNEWYIDRKGNRLGLVEDWEEDEDTGERRLTKQPVPEDVAWLYDGEAFVDVIPTFEISWDVYTDDIADSWYVRHSRVLPLQRILALYPGDEALERLKDAKENISDGRSLRWNGLMNMAGISDVTSPDYERLTARKDDALGYLDREYRVTETWIFPKDEQTRKLWGDKGALITTVGGALIEDPRPLPEWAVKACPFIQFPEEPEEGNHYGKPPARDVVPLQDDVNRIRATAQEAFALRSRLLLHAPNNAGLNLKILGGFPGMLLQTRSMEQKPTPIDLGNGSSGWEGLYQTALSAANDTGNANDASTGKLPSAGLSAKAVYALQYADERSISEASNLQDIALKRLAESLDQIVRVEYSEARKVRLVGDDRKFLVEHEITPEQLCVDVDYAFLPGSMMARQKEAVKNEMLSLKEAGLISDVTVKRNLSAAIPEAFALDFDTQEAHARRVLDNLTKTDNADPYQPQPWEDPAVHAEILGEWLLSERAERFYNAGVRDRVAQLWQVYAQMANPAPAPAAGQPAAPAGPVAPISMDANGGAPAPAEGAQMMEQMATEVAPPPGFGTPGAAQM